MRDTRMIAGHETLGEINIVVMGRRDAAMESLLLDLRIESTPPRVSQSALGVDLSVLVVIVLIEEEGGGCFLVMQFKRAAGTKQDIVKATIG
jgi:hypothetical protein